MATALKNVRTLLANQSVSATTTVRGVLGLQTALGGIVTYKITNSGTLGAQCVANLLVAHNGTTPASAAAGTDWKTIYSVGNGTTSGTVGEWSYTFGPEIMNLEIEFTGHTTNAVVVEAFVSEFTSVG